MRWIRLAIASLLAASSLVVVESSASAFAQTSGHESLSGFIVASGVSGERQVVSSLIVGKGVFNGVGRIVEMPNLPNDPDNVNRDDLVFKAGTMHIRNTILDFQFSFDPDTCIFTGTVPQTNTVEGGTGVFTNATGTFTATVKGKGILPRNADGSCSVDRDPLAELDVITATGTLSF